MSTSSNLTPWAAYRAWSRSLPVQIAMIPMAAFCGFRATHNGLAGLGFGIAAAISLAVRLQLTDRRRRRRAARAHIAGLSDWD